MIADQIVGDAVYFSVCVNCTHLAEKYMKMKVLYTSRIRMQKHTIQIYIQIRTQATLCCSSTNGLLVSGFGSSTRGEIHSSYYANPIPTRGTSCGV